MQKVITESLARLLGEDAAKAIEFFADSRLVVADPDQYERKIVHLFGERGASVIISGIEASLCEWGGMETKRWKSLGACVNAVAAARPRESQLAI